MNRWAGVVGYVVLAVALVVSMHLAREQVRAESRRADTVACESQREGRKALVEVLEETANFFTPVVESPEGREYVALLRRRVNDLDLPIPCEVELGLTPES